MTREGSSHRFARVSHDNFSFVRLSDNWRQSLERFKSPGLREVWSDDEAEYYGDNLLLAILGPILVLGEEGHGDSLVLVDLRTKAVVTE